MTTSEFLISRRGNSKVGELCTCPRITCRCIANARAMMNKDVELCRHKADTREMMNKDVELCRHKADSRAMMNIDVKLCRHKADIKVIRGEGHC